MEITDVKMHEVAGEGRLRAVATVVFDGEMAVHDIKVIEGENKLFLAMPSRRMPDGSYHDVVHPITAQMRVKLEDKVLGIYLENE